MPLVRAIGILSAVGIVTSVITFAALQSTGNALTGNSIETATANLQLSNDGQNFSDSVPGFDFANIIPGGAAQPQTPYEVTVKNVGTTNLLLTVSTPTAPTVNGIDDLSKVHVLITPYTMVYGAYPVITASLADLTDGAVPLTWGTDSSMVRIGTSMKFRLQVAMDADAVNGSSGSVTNLDLSFSGTPH